MKKQNIEKNYLLSLKRKYSDRRRLRLDRSIDTLDIIKEISSFGKIMMGTNYQKTG